MDEGKEGGMWEIHFKHIGDIGGSKSQNETGSGRLKLRIEITIESLLVM